MYEREYQSPAKNCKITQITTATTFLVLKAMIIVATRNPRNNNVAKILPLLNIFFNCLHGPTRNIVPRIAMKFPTEYRMTKPMTLPNDIATIETKDKIQPRIKQKRKPRTLVS